jgi:murein DD-endopeptidase MepM/ murein hydrolase activator NlpD
MRGTVIALFLLSAPGEADETLLRTVDLNLGEWQEVQLSDGKKATVKLLDLEETRDEVNFAVRRARVKVEINGNRVTLTAGTYHLPVPVAGIQIDCTITGGYNRDSRTDPWGLLKAARLRLWPAGSPWMPPGTFVYPLRQLWFASMTQLANEPVFVVGEEVPGPQKIYYHYGIDLGGSEGRVDVVAATEGRVVSLGKEVLPEADQPPVAPRYDVVYLKDSRDWYYRYSHLKSIDPAIRLGERVKLGQKIGVLGKEGASGGWSHLHFDISSLQPSGKWGIQEAYAFLWEAYQREYFPKIIAIARPHVLGWTGQPVKLDGSHSWSSSGKITRYDWIFSNGKTASGSEVERTYEQPGSYSEILKITDAEGRVDYDFQYVQVLDKANPQALPPTIHPNYAPTIGIKPGDPVTFKVRTYRTTDGEEIWDFGDGTSAVTVKSDGNVVRLAPDGYAETIHRFEKIGVYIVTVERSNKEGMKAIGHLKVVVE